MHRMPVDKLLQNIQFRIRQKIPCKGIIFAGSRQQGEYREDSDWDFYVLTDIDTSIKNGRQSFRFESEVVDVFCNQWASAGGHSQGKGKDQAGLCMLAKGDVIFVCDENARQKIQQLQEQARSTLAGKPKFDRQITANTLKTYLWYLDSKNQPDYYSQLEAINYIIETSYNLYGAWLPKPKDIDKDIEFLDEAIYKIYLGAHGKLHHNRIACTNQLIKYLVDKFQIDLDQATVYDPHPIDIPAHRSKGLDFSFYTELNKLQVFRKLEIPGYFLYAQTMFSVVQWSYGLHKELMPGFKYRGYATQYKPRDMLEQDMRRIDPKWCEVYIKACTGSQSNRMIKTITMMEYLVQKFGLQYNLENL